MIVACNLINRLLHLSRASYRDVGCSLLSTKTWFTWSIRPEMVLNIKKKLKVNKGSIIDYGSIHTHLKCTKLKDFRRHVHQCWVLSKWMEFEFECRAWLILSTPEYVYLKVDLNRNENKKINKKLDKLQYNHLLCVPW